MHKVTRRLLLCAVAVALASGSIPDAARAQTYPSGVVRLIAGSPPGSAPDTIARVVTEKLQVSLGQPVIVESRMGAGGMIASQAVARGAPDGHMINIAGSGFTVASLLNPGVVSPKELAPVAMMATFPIVLVVSSERGPKTLDELVARAKAKPGSLIGVSAGVGTTTHLSLERFRASAGIEFLHVPQRGAAEAVTEVLAGRADLYFAPVFSVISYIQSGTLRPLAMGTPKRTSMLPGVATTLELGYPDSDYTLWAGAMVAAKTPDAIVERLHKAFNAAIEAPDVRERINKIGAEPATMSLSAFAAMVDRELASNAKLIDAIGMKRK